jgi:hypothetical protein
MKKEQVIVFISHIIPFNETLIQFNKNYFASPLLYVQAYLRAKKSLKTYFEISRKPLNPLNHGGLYISNTMAYICSELIK